MIYFIGLFMLLMLPAADECGTKGVRMTEQDREKQRNTQRFISHMQHLEQYYHADIKTESDLAHYKEKWIKDGRPQPSWIVRKEKPGDNTLSFQGRELPRHLTIHWQDLLR